MARYIGPKLKSQENSVSPSLERTKPSKNATILLDSTAITAESPKKSEYAIQLMEKQKAKYTYGILERQFRNLFEKASRSKGVTGEVLLQLCESRLDNVAYRMGLARSRSGARQLVSHRHVTVNGQIVNIPSYQLKVGDVVGVREKSKSLQSIAHAMDSHAAVYEWITWDKDSMQGTFVNVPERLQIPENIKEQLIVELYSK